MKEGEDQLVWNDGDDGRRRPAGYVRLATDEVSENKRVVSGSKCAVVSGIA